MALRYGFDIGSVDLAPILAIVIIFLLLDFLPDYVLAYLSRRNLTLWPS